MSIGQRRVLRSTHAPSGMLEEQDREGLGKPTNASSAGDACEDEDGGEREGNERDGVTRECTAPARKSRVTRPLEAGRSSNAW